MAMPMAAWRRAGASLTPSPVIAVTSPSLLSMRTRRCLSAGSARQKTRLPDRSSAVCWPSGSAKKALPVNVHASSGSPGAKIPTSLATACAVSFESPVIMMTRMPAARHALIAPPTLGRGGSRIPTRPRKVRPDSTSAKRAGSRSSRAARASAEPSCDASAPSARAGLDASAMQRSAALPIAEYAATIASRAAGSRRAEPPSGSRTCVHRASTESGAPLTSSRAHAPRAPTSRTRADFDLRARVNSSVASLSTARRGSFGIAAGPASAGSGRLPPTDAI